MAIHRAVKRMSSRMPLRVARGPAAARNGGLPREDLAGCARRREACARNVSKWSRTIP